MRLLLARVCGFQHNRKGQRQGVFTTKSHYKGYFLECVPATFVSLRIFVCLFLCVAVCLSLCVLLCIRVSCGVSISVCVCLGLRRRWAWEEEVVFRGSYYAYTR
jgi:hypothetical protein